MSRLDRVLGTLAVAAALVACPGRSTACESGVCDGTVTVDGRPLLWKLRVQVDIPNDVHYFAAGVEHLDGLGPALHSYLGIGPRDDAPAGPVRMGANARGLAIGFNSYHAGDWQELHHRALGFATTTAEVDTMVLAMTDLGTIHYDIDAGGHATLWETDRNPQRFWQYESQAPARAAVLRDFDDDGDEISYAGWVGRANTIHMHPDGTDSLLYGEADRTAAAQTVPGRLVDGGRLSVRDLASDYFRHDVLAMDTSVASLIVHGVHSDEDARLTTLWIALGHPEAAIFVPVWLFGVESGGVPAIPDHLDDSDGDGVYLPAKGLVNAGADEVAIQERTLPVEERFLDVVLDELLPAWRARDWQDEGVVAAIGAEMKRVQEQMDADAYSLLDRLFLSGVDDHAPVLSGIDGWTADDLTVTFTATAADEDGLVASVLWRYGDGETGADTSHAYAAPGTYLVSFTVTDEAGVSFTDWEFVTVDVTSAASGGAEAAAGPIALHPCFPNPCNPRTVIAFELARAGEVRLSVVDLRGRRVRTLAHGEHLGAGRHEVIWDGRDDREHALPAGVYCCVLECGGVRAMQRVALVR